MDKRVVTTIVLPISRTDYLKPVFDCLRALDCPKDTELVIITDGDKSLEQAVDRRLNSINFKRIQVASFGNSPGEDINSRRYRISELHNKAKYLVSPESDYIFSIEDDTTYPPDTLSKMLNTFKSYEDCMYVQGVELGRHKTKYIGGWMVDDIYNPTYVESVMPELGVKPIDAGGLYCALIDAELYRVHHFEPFDKEGTNGLSCDVNFGLWLRRKGWDCYIDFGIQCDHIGDKGSVNLGNTKPVQVVFEKRMNKWISYVAPHV